MKFVFLIGLLIATTFSCSENGVADSRLKGTWISADDTGGVEFVDFSTGGEGRWVFLKKGSVESRPFNFRFTQNKLFVNFEEDSNVEQTYEVRFEGDTQIKMMNAADGSAGQDFIRRTIKTNTATDTLVLSYGETYYDSNNGFRLELDSVNNDSRCPEGVQCIWAGSVQADLSIQFDGQEKLEFSLNTNIEPKTKSFESVTVKLVDVTPHPKNNTKIVDSDYKVLLLLD